MRGFKSRTLRQKTFILYNLLITKNLTPKHLEKVEISENLFKDILYVNSLIVGKDESAMEETDDCIQTDYLCGGLWNKESSLYGFSYYPDKIPSDSSWEFELTANQIGGIASGEVTVLDLWKCDSPDCKHYYAHESDRCTFCNPVDSTHEPKYSSEDIQQIQNDKRELLDKWKTTLK